jgi:hypothetical protein
MAPLAFSPHLTLGSSWFCSDKCLESLQERGDRAMALQWAELALGSQQARHMPAPPHVPVTPPRDTRRVTLSADSIGLVVAKLRRNTPGTLSLTSVSVSSNPFSQTILGADGSFIPEPDFSSPGDRSCSESDRRRTDGRGRKWWRRQIQPQQEGSLSIAEFERARLPACVRRSLMRSSSAGLAVASCRAPALRPSGTGPVTRRPTLAIGR